MRDIPEYLAAPQGFEPRYADPESAVLPLNEGAVKATGLAAAQRALPTIVLAAPTERQPRHSRSPRGKGDSTCSNATFDARSFSVTSQPTRTAPATARDRMTGQYKPRERTYGIADGNRRILDRLD